MDDILTELVDQPPTEDEAWAFSSEARKVLLSVRHRGRVDVSGRPSFNISGSFVHEDIVVETVTSKLHKRYETPHPIELLAYFGDRAWDLSRDWTQPLQEVIRSEGLGQFRRIWVMGWHGIRFVYPGLDLLQ